MTTTRPRTIAIVGLGPRGLSVLERVCANARQLAAGTALVIHLIDPYPPGAGRVWRTAQSRHLLMNTVAGQLSAFTDDSVALSGPLEPGPSLYEWAKFLALMGPVDNHDPATVEEARRLTPDVYPTRAFYGRYLEWVFERVTRAAPPNVSVISHRAVALALDDMPGGPPRPDSAGRSEPAVQQVLTLRDGTRVSHLDAVVLAQGHLPRRQTATEKRFSTFASTAGLRYLPPANPADIDLSPIRPGENVLLRGLGLTFFDYLTLLSTGRGGAFVRDAERLVYRPSGEEPRLFAGSRRGIPYQARGENQKGQFGRHQPWLLTPERIADLRGPASRPGGLDFRRQIWPLIAKEVETVYYCALLASEGCSCDADRFRDRYLALPWGDPHEAELLLQAGVPDALRWSWERLADPTDGHTFTSRHDFQAWILGHLRRDIGDARRGNVAGPLKAALDVLRDLRNEIRELVDHAGLDGASYERDLQHWYTPLNAYLSIGPPVSRVEEMAALITAGTLQLLGPGPCFRADERAGAFVANAARVTGPPVHAGVFIEARLPEPQLTQTADPLLRHLLATGQCAPYRVPITGGGWYETPGLAVGPRPYHLLDKDGAAHPARFAFGVPTESVHWTTAAGIRPGVGSVTLTDSDAIARALLLLAPASHLNADPAAAVP